jgi:hypothetical protein
MRCAESPRQAPKLCRTYGAPDFLCDFSQALLPGLTYAAPRALVCGNGERTGSTAQYAQRIRTAPVV